VIILTKINKKYVTPSFILTLVLIASIYGTTSALADDTTYPRIVSKIAQKFGLEEEDVNEVFEQDRLQMWEDRKKTQEERLSDAVSDGIITEEQKRLLIEEMNDWQAERSAQREDRREEMGIFFTENGIDHEKLMPYMGRGGMGRHKGTDVFQRGLGFEAQSVVR